MNRLLLYNMIHRLTDTIIFNGVNGGNVEETCRSSIGSLIVLRETITSKPSSDLPDNSVVMDRLYYNKKYRKVKEIFFLRPYNFSLSATGLCCRLH